ncbi:hypothetical protein F2Q69_00051647 [Brassica cretica]|uniref:Uncharacterized protein n=1 Tax=Brassica cretica TaxID=69181 RepID=A0A8S9PPA0_BRACR|nr:hypothetical protein F2Q69_00051647 [Brassica cretica]
MKLTEQNRSMSWNRHQTQAFSHSQIAEMAEDLQGDYLKDTALPGFADSPVRESIYSRLCVSRDSGRQGRLRGKATQTTE